MQWKTVLNTPTRFPPTGCLFPSTGWAAQTRHWATKGVLRRPHRRQDPRRREEGGAGKDRRQAQIYRGTSQKDMSLSGRLYFCVCGTLWWTNIICHCFVTCLCALKKPRALCAFVLPLLAGYSQEGCFLDNTHVVIWLGTVVSCSL